MKTKIGEMAQQEKGVFNQMEQRLIDLQNARNKLQNLQQQYNSEYTTWTATSLADENEVGF
jgi:hypothetical protein